MKNVEISNEEVKTAESLELIVIEKTVGTLDTNIAELEKFVDERLKEYDPKNFEGDADLAKKKRAELNTAKQKLTRSRIDLIKELMKPYNDFEERCKALEKKVDTASSYLDEIVKAKEQEEKEKKRKKIEIFWQTKNFDLFPLEKIFNDKWLNKTYKESDILDEMDAVIERTYKDLKTIEKYSDIADTLKAHYLMTLNIGDTLDYGEELKKQKEIAEREAKDRVEREHQQKLNQQKENLWEEVNEVKNPNSTSNLASMALSGTDEVKAPERKEFVIAVNCFETDLLKLKGAMNQFGIEFSVQELTF